tara:strand:+ start:547 stop:2838 length:2292 start_codon:yes stop_codon:yes gene_type:complete
MKDPKVYVHCSYIGTTGYNNHAQSFFKSLSKSIDLKIRNFTVGKSWVGNNDEPHNNESYINDLDKKLLVEQTLNMGNGNRNEFPIYTKYKNNFNHNVNLILNETNHYYFYEDYVGPKIGYNVWESTLQPQSFFDKWNEFDQLWVPSKWQAQCTINQGADPNKVKVVPEGVDINTFYPEEVNHNDYDDGRFKFILFGRWDYRKSTKEIIETFLKEFKPSEPIDLILSIDNPFSGDDFKTTEERLEHYKLIDERLKIKHFPSREEYIKYIKKGHVFLSCARSEGWNLPLIEAMACGTPSIYSACSGQMEFAEGKGLPVKILGEKPALDADYNHFNSTVGNYYEPDFDDLAKVMRNAYENYADHKSQALKDAKIIHKEFNWDAVAEIGKDTLNEFVENYKEIEDTNKIVVTYDDGPKVEILGNVNKEYNVEFVDKSCNCVIHRDTIKNNMWTSCGRKYYTEWVVKVNGKIIDEFSLKDKKVLIQFKSKSIGDNIAWLPYIEEFRKKYNCKVVCHTFFNDWFKEQYPKIEFGWSTDYFTTYHIGWFYDEKDWNAAMHPNDFKPQPLQKTACDILGLEYKEIKTNIKTFPISPIKEKYATISMQSTSQCKYWNHPTGWQQVVNYLQEKGYKTVSVDLNPTFGSGNVLNKIPKTDYNYNNKPLNEVMGIIENADIHLGIGSGLSWAAWALNVPVVLISSFSKPYCEFTTNCLRIYNDTPTAGYFNTHKLDAGNWNWYPFKNINTHEDWYSVENITPEQVIKDLQSFIKL